MKVGIVIFSRIDSRRLPGKALRPINGRALIGHVIDRAAAVFGAAGVVVATSDRDTDDPIATFALENGTSVFRGDVHDVLHRAHVCAETHGFDAIVRICGDSPFIDPHLIEDFIARHKKERPDITTNIFPRTYPPGMSFEVIATETLARAAAEAHSPQDREHVTPYIYAHPEKFNILNIESGEDDHWETPLTVDTPEDLVHAHWLARRLAEDGADYAMHHVLALARQWRSMRPLARKVSA